MILPRFSYDAGPGGDLPPMRRVLQGFLRTDILQACGPPQMQTRIPREARVLVEGVCWKWWRVVHWRWFLGGLCEWTDTERHVLFATFSPSFHWNLISCITTWIFHVSLIPFSDKGTDSLWSFPSYLNPSKFHPRLMVRLSRKIRKYIMALSVVTEIGKADLSSRSGDLFKFSSLLNIEKKENETQFKLRFWDFGQIKWSKDYV